MNILIDNACKYSRDAADGQHFTGRQRGDFNALAFTPLSGAPFGTPGVCRRSPTTTRPKNLNRCALILPP
jgi:hypothetical protein